MFEAATLELLIANGNNFVDQQDIGVHVNGNRETQAHIHATRIDLHWRIDERLHPCKLNDVVDHRIDFTPLETKN